ncbi:hypothetical protein KAT63_03755 [Candidatus Parcubacteria bacterium]|nr:hypothetical protein [Candidatus Parcubacteria bacterium]
MKIILDFDDTIFNTHRLMREFLEIVKKFGFTEKEFFKAYQKCKEKVGDFNPKTIIELLNEIRPFDKTKAEKKVSLMLDDLKDFIYSDFFDFAKSFNKEDLILLSFGTTGTQKIKINNSKIAEFFKDIIITSRDKTDKTEDVRPIFEKYKKEKIFFIDDKTIQVDNIKNNFPEIITMEMKRPQGSGITTESRLADHIIKDLYDARNIVGNYFDKN